VQKDSIEEQYKAKDKEVEKKMWNSGMILKPVKKQ